MSKNKELGVQGSGDSSLEIVYSGEKVEPLTPEELRAAVDMYGDQHADYLRSRGVDMKATDPVRGAEWMEYMKKYNEASRMGAELNPGVAREDLRKYEEEKAKNKK